MIPSLACDYTNYGCVVHAKLFSNLDRTILVRMLHVTLANLNDLFFRELGIGAFPSFRRACSPPPFGVHVGIILLDCSEPEMVRINTQSVITSRAIVKNAQSVGDWPDVNNPRDSMCSSKNTVAGFIANSCIDCSIPFAINRCSPQPTRFSFLNVLPKALHDGWGKVLRGEVFRRNLNHSLSFAAYGLRILRGIFIINKSRWWSIPEPS